MCRVFFSSQTDKVSEGTKGPDRLEVRTENNAIYALYFALIRATKKMKITKHVYVLGEKRAQKRSPVLFSEHVQGYRKLGWWRGKEKEKEG